MRPPEETTNRRPRASFPIARVAGIEVRVHVTFLLLLALFAAAGPNAGFGSPWQSVAWVIVIFACVVGHEFAHSLVARRRGGEVHEILLFPLGGISKLERLPERPQDEFAVAIAGPLASFAIAGAAAVAAVVAGRSLLPVDLVHGAWLSRLVWLNLLLGAFNLLPAFPLDGGRVFRALLERHTDLESATMTATKVGHAFAIGLMVVGFAFDVWLILIGVFVYFGASAERSATIVHLRLLGHRVDEVMRSDLDRIGPVPRIAAGSVTEHEPLTDDIVAAVAGAPGHQLAVVRDDTVVGVLRLEDIQRFVQDASVPLRSD